MLNIYYCELECLVSVSDAPTPYGWTDIVSKETVGEVVCATSRGHARSLVANANNLDFTHPMSIRKVKHSMNQSDLVDGWFMNLDGYYIDDGLLLWYWDGFTDDATLLYESE